MPRDAQLAVAAGGAAAGDGPGGALHGHKAQGTEHDVYRTGES
jgi:hypothetical protein